MDGKLQKSRSGGCLRPPLHGPPLLWSGALLRAWHTRGPPTTGGRLASAARLQELLLSQATQLHKEAGTPCTPGREPGLSGPGEGGEEGPGPVTLRRLTQTPPHYSPPAPRDPREHPRRAAAERTSEPPNFAQLIAAPPRVRGARRPSPSMASYLTVPTPRCRRPLRGLARAAAPGAEGPAPGRRPQSRGRLLPAGYSTWVRVTGRHEAGSEHCPSAAILPGDRAWPSSQWGARGAVVLTYHAREASCIQSEADTGSGAAIQRAGRRAGPSGESESGAPRSLGADQTSGQSGASAGRILANQGRGGFQHRTVSRIANPKVNPGPQCGQVGPIRP